MKYLYFLAFIFFHSSAFSQDISWPIRSIQNVPYANPAEISAEYKKYPYADVIVMVRNAEKLTSQSFVNSYFRSLRYFYGELNLSGAGQITQKIPLFLFQKNENKFNTTSLEDRTIIKKYLYNPDGTNSLDGTISTSIAIKDRLLVFINSLSKVIKPLISSPSSLLSHDAAVKSYEFFDELLEKASQDRVLDAKVGFEVFSPFFKKIRSYKIFIIAPTNAVLPNADQLILTKSTSGYFQLVRNGTPYQDFPYVVILQTLNNYNGEENNIPSKWMERNGIFDVIKEAIKLMDSTLTISERLLSNQQYFAERTLIDHLKVLHAIRVATDNQPENEERLEKMKVAYSSLSKLSGLKKSFNAVESSLRTDQEIGYQQKIRLLNDEIERKFKQLTYSDELFLLNTLLQSASNDMSNNQLGVLSSINSRLSDIAYLKQNVLLMNALEKQKAVEEELVRKYFKSNCEKLSTVEEVSPENTELKSEIQNLSNSYSNCTSCVAMSKAAVGKYNDLVSEDESRKLLTAIRDTLFYASDVMKVYKRKIGTYTLLPDSTKQTLGFNVDLTSVQREFSDLENKFETINAISKMKFTARERREIYALLTDLKFRIKRFEEGNKTYFEQVKDIVKL